MDVLPLDRQVCFALYSASRAVTARYRPLLDELGLTYPQYLVLLALWEHDGRTVKELGTALRLDSSTLSPLLKRLEAGGLVARERRADDERSVTVRLTPAGAALRTRAAALPARLLCADGLGVEELAELRVTLTRLTAALDKALHNQPSNNQTLSNPTPDNRAPDNQALDNRALDNRALDNRAPDNRALDNPPLTPTDQRGEIDAGALHG